MKVLLSYGLYIEFGIEIPTNIYYAHLRNNEPQTPDLDFMTSTNLEDLKSFLIKHDALEFTLRQLPFYCKMLGLQK